MHIRYMCRLHIVSSEPDTLLVLCKFFEDLLMERDPQMFYHLLQLNIHPLSIAFHWIFHGFSGYLKVEELLLLWDRILGFGNLYLVPVLAAAIFWFRSKFLLRASTQQEIYVSVKSNWDAHVHVETQLYSRLTLFFPKYTYMHRMCFRTSQRLSVSHFCNSSCSTEQINNVLY